MKKKKQRELSAFRRDLRRDWNTLKSLRGKALLRQLWDYYRYFFLAVVCAAVALGVTVHMIWEGKQPCRLQVCVVLNEEDISCQRWFDQFEQALSADGAEGRVDLNEDQPFDYDNMYYYVQELEVMTKVSSQRIDVAICGEDLYSYLLALNACMPLDEALPEDLQSAVSQRLVYSTANLQIDAQGNVDPDDGIDGYFALDLTGTGFDAQYNQGSDGKLYAVIISNTEHFEDSVALLRTLTAQ